MARQQAPKVYEHAASTYVLDPQYLKRASSIFEGRVLPYEMPSDRCIDIDEDNFLILVSKESKSLSQIYISIAHELVHVKQFMYDNLGTLLDQGYEYDTCWWEQEARERSERFLLEFVKYFKLNG